MRSICLVAPALALAACVTTQEMPLAPNVVRLDTHASGDMFGEDAPGQTMRRAAEVTLQNGFSYFQLQQAQMSQGSEMAGVYAPASSAFATPIYHQTADVAVTVVMFHANDIGAKSAFNAADVLKKYRS